MPHYDVVTVVYADEVDLLALQAQSIRLFGRQLSINRIYIIVNGPQQDRTLRRVAAEVLPRYGERAAQVEIVPAGNLMACSETASGWHTQQVLKLAIADRIETDHYIVLDAKNHMVVQSGDAIFFSTDGRAHFQPISFREAAATMKPHFQTCALICGIDAESHIDGALPSHTPVVLCRSHVLGLHSFLREYHRTSVETLLCRSYMTVTEFRLYYCYLCRSNVFDALYTQGPPIVTTLWAAQVDDHRLFERTMGNAETSNIPFFSLHRLARMRLTKQQAARIAAFWQKAGLVAGEREAQSWLAPPGANENL
jgi:hypothetical protein